MLRVLVLVYIFSAANGLLMVALDRALGFTGSSRPAFAKAQPRSALSVLS